MNKNNVTTQGENTEVAQENKNVEVTQTSTEANQTEKSNNMSKQELDTTLVMASDGTICTKAEIEKVEKNITLKREAIKEELAKLEKNKK